MRACTRLSASAPSRSVVRRFRPTVETLETRTVLTLGSEFSIDISLSEVRDVRSASSANGTSVVVWSEDVGGGDFNIFAQRFDTSNNSAGGPITVSDDSDFESDADVAMDAAGNFVVVWERNIGNAGDLDVVYATYDSTGAQITSSVVASSGSTDEANPKVTMNGAGIWTVAFEVGSLNGDDIFARRLDLDGDPQGSDIVVANNPFSHEEGPVIDGNTAGRFVIAYRLHTSTADFLYVKRYSPTGKLLGKSKVATDLDAKPTDFLHEYDVAMDNAGNTTVVYSQSFLLDQSSIFSRKVTKAGVLERGRPCPSLMAMNFSRSLAWTASPAASWSPSRVPARRSCRNATRTAA